MNRTVVTVNGNEYLIECYETSFTQVCRIKLNDRIISTAVCCEPCSNQPYPYSGVVQSASYQLMRHHCKGDVNTPRAIVKAMERYYMSRR